MEIKIDRDMRAIKDVLKTLATQDDAQALNMEFANLIAELNARVDEKFSDIEANAGGVNEDLEAIGCVISVQRLVLFLLVDCFLLGFGVCLLALLVTRASNRMLAPWARDLP